MVNMILIFKTSVQSKAEVLGLKPSIEDIVKEGTWSFDLEDSDKIFRVENEMDITRPLRTLFNARGFLCEELED